MLKSLYLVSIAGVIVSLACVEAAQAQGVSLVTYVSGKGSDSGSCGDPSSPCRSFQFAVNRTPREGEVKALDPADYGPVIISKPISITGVDGAGIHVPEPLGAPPGTRIAAITITRASDSRINLTRLVLQGNGISSQNVGADGIVADSGMVTITHCTIRNFFGTGIIVQESQPSFLISHTLVSDNVYGISVYQLQAGTAQGVLDHVWLDRNRGTGLGVYAFGAAGGQTHVTVVESAATNNGSPLFGSFGFAVQGNSTLTLAHSTTTGSDVGIQANSPAALISYGDNYIKGDVKDIDGDVTVTRVGTQ
jgi:hypothetical protein